MTELFKNKNGGRFGDIGLYAFSTLTLLVWRQEQHLACKN